MDRTVADGRGRSAAGQAPLRESDSMVLSPERRTRIRQRLEPILKEYNPELQFISVFVDSTREYLGVVAQLAERPVLLKFRWVDFISIPDPSLRDALFSQLEQKLGPPEPPLGKV